MVVIKYQKVFQEKTFVVKKIPIIEKKWLFQKPGSKALAEIISRDAFFFKTPFMFFLSCLELQYNDIKVLKTKEGNPL